MTDAARSLPLCWCYCQHVQECWVQCFGSAVYMLGSAILLLCTQSQQLGPVIGIGHACSVMLMVCDLVRLLRATALGGSCYDC